MRRLVVAVVVAALVVLAGPAEAKNYTAWRSKRLVVVVDQRRNDAIYTFTNRTRHPIRFTCYWGTDGGVASYLYSHRLRPLGSVDYGALGTYTKDSMECRARRTDA